ncbi:hypothetical protein QBD01_003653 [Ochrobactrum sp. 19YEA23]|nr:hypothetical protein [Ochrobactrum sp. 19YEA23]
MSKCACLRGGSLRQVHTPSAKWLTGFTILRPGVTLPKLIKFCFLDIANEATITPLV